MGAAVKFKVTSVPRQQGERARLKVVRGPDYGATFVLTADRATIGRGEDNDIVISDLKSSRQHAEVRWSGMIWVVRDLGSANGIVHNGNRVRAANLGPRDSITIGETTLEFVSGENGTMVLIAPPRDSAVVENEEKAFEEQRRKVRALGGLGAGMARAAQPVRAPASPQPGKNKLLLLGGAAVVAVLVMMTMGDEDDQAKNAKSKAAKAKAAAGSELDRYLPNGEPEAQTKSAELFFKSGFREYNQGNFLRAKTQFETALQISPSHAMATLYLRNCETRIKEEVEARLRKGKKALGAGKLREARGHFEQTLRLLYRDQTNPHFVEAKDQLETVNKLIRNEPPGGTN